ncbi:hypothetical protein AK830_g1539 [Neonectria ditissima]|uniref:BZIP domain-containing protein n=1 Tax=Neonectria ditissima TaxID=78410 RepID=A0A0P7BUC5_9HYPO|nr:hypothetical protein AK830_g1539 [Neonectria ditissima]
MASYNGRRGPNVSQYLRDLNAINRQEAGQEEPFNMEEDLALFTNTQFFDFETGQNTDYQAHPAKADGEAAPPSASPSEDMTPAQSVMGDMNNLDFSIQVFKASASTSIALQFPIVNSITILFSGHDCCVFATLADHRTMAGDFSFPDFANAYPSTPLSAFPDNAQNFQSMQANPAAAYPQVPQTQHHQSHFGQAGTPQSGEKRKSESDASGAGRSLDFEDSSRHAAEEDKRRRNTAASARFRIKKKQREQALEKSAKEMSEKVSNLESKVQQLEMENKWLKNLLVEKNEGNDEIVSLWKEFAASKQTGDKAKPKSKPEPVKAE